MSNRRHQFDTKQQTDIDIELQHQRILYSQNDKFEKSVMHLIDEI